jgi:hypothetical protein
MSKRAIRSTRHYTPGVPKGMVRWIEGLLKDTTEQRPPPRPARGSHGFNLFDLGIDPGLDNGSWSSFHPITRTDVAAAFARIRGERYTGISIGAMQRGPRPYTPELHCLKYISMPCLDDCFVCGS